MPVLALGGTAELVLDRSRAVMLAVLDNGDPQWPSVQRWKDLLPGWFVTACAPERSQQETDEWLAWWRTLGPAEQARADGEQPWELADWLHWLMPSERQWFWWDAVIEAAGTLRVTVEVAGWPAPLGALDWLLRASGAGEVSHQENARA